MNDPLPLRPELRRCVLFVAGADERAHAAALAARPDVVVQDLEDFTPRDRKLAARQSISALAAHAAERRLLLAVRINAQDDGGAEDAAAAVAAGVRIVLLPKASADAVSTLDCALAHAEGRPRAGRGGTEIVPNIETAAGIADLARIVKASPRVASALLATEDLAADLCAERGPDAEELAYARARFLLDARALAIEPVDAPYTYSDAEGCERETRRSRRLGYRSKSAVSAAHVGVVQRIMTPSVDEIVRARRIIEAFEKARAQGVDRPLVDGLWIEPPAYRNAQRLIERAAALEGGESAANR